MDTRAQKRTLEADAFRNRYENRAFCIYGLCLGYEAVELLRQVRETIKQGKDLSNDIVATPTSLFDLVSSDASSSNMIGAEKKLKEIKDHILNKQIELIGIYGMAGVGKTALLKIIQNEFFSKTECPVKFEVVIWVDVSESKEDVILRTIVPSLGVLPDTSRDTVLTSLARCSFALLLDDVWEDLNLVDDIRDFIRKTGKNSKILFTTRSEEIIDRLEPDERVKVEPLDRGKSWQLFKSKIASDILNNSEIRPLAEKVVARCGGLPTYLIYVRRRMASARTADEWERAAYALAHSPTDYFKDMGKVLQRLRRSYDKLNDAGLRDCFLYCALFPRGYAIPKEQIIDYWICEGFLDDEESDESDITHLRMKGGNKIMDLRKASVLEAADDHSVKLHDAVRDMILWVARSDDHQFVVLAGDVYCVPNRLKWQRARRISFIGNRNIGLPDQYWDSISPELTTLLLGDSVHAKNVNRQGFFGNLPALKVLDLKGGGLQQFPAEITSVTSLQYLNLSDIPSLSNIADHESFQELKLRIKRP